MMENMRKIEAQRRIVELAHQFLDGDIELALAAQELSRIGQEIGHGLSGCCFVETPKALRVFSSIDREMQSNNIPVGEWRKHWNTEVLAKKTELQKQIEEKYREAAIATCRALIDKLS